jgi:hypothetical protein
MNKGQIRSQFIALLNRNDCSNELADTFIEQGLARIQRTLRVPSMEKTAVYTINDVAPETLALPNDFLNIKYLYCGTTLLQYVDLGKYLQAPSYVDTPSMYTRLQGNLKLKPIPAEGTEVLMVYYGEIPDLAEDTDTNFLSVIAPDLLIYGALSYAADYFIDERKGLFEETYGRVYQELVEQASLTEMDQSSLAIGTPFNTEY